MFLLTFLVGLLMLVAGAHFLVEGGGRVAIGLRIPGIIVGLTVVAFGTSAPELSVSVTAALQGTAPMAMANVNGSNIANIFLVLGLAALVRPLTVKRELLYRDIPTVIALQLLVLLLAFDNEFGRNDGIIVVVVGIAYNVWMFYDVFKARKNLGDVEDVERKGTLGVNLLKLVGGLVVLVIGADLFVTSAIEVATYLNFSERLIGLTVVALGTSAPEAAAAITAARNGDVDMALGGSVGSNILNIAMVLGITAIISPIDLSSGGFVQDMAVALLSAVLLVPMVLTGGVSRRGGLALIAIYVSYMGIGIYQGTH